VTDPASLAAPAPRGGPGVRRGLRRRALGVLLDAAYLLAAPLVLLALAWPSRLFTRRRYRAGLRGKLGDVPRRDGAAPCLWVHAVSVGELRAALPLVEALRPVFPGWDLWVSVSTAAGMDLASRSLPAGVQAFWFPLDLGFAVRRTFRRVRPAAVVLLELEVWPNFLLEAGAAGVPVLVANGRLSDRSYPRYRRLGFLARALFGAVTSWGVQEEEYARRLAGLGVPAGRVRVLGNLKYDGAPAGPVDPSATRRLLAWEGAPVLVAGCTHPGEEEAALGAWAAVRGAAAPGGRGLRLVLAPRHIERAREVAGLAASRGAARLWSQVRDGSGGAGPPVEVLVVDVIGELDRFYAAADVVFVGGSLIPRGGHNLLEPARAGKPVLFGPHTFNFEAIARHLLERGAGVRVDGPEALAAEAERLLADPEARRILGERARAAAAELSGATARHIGWIGEVLGLPEQGGSCISPVGKG
jgi:3-deoxy-D-manno-octulosonic-acid transferase